MKNKNALSPVAYATKLRVDEEQSDDIDYK